MIRDLTQLAADTLRSPRDVAKRLIAMGFSTEMLWTALLLICVLNALVFSMNLMVLPPDPAQPRFMQMPMIFAFVSFASAVISVFGLYWMGRVLGGSAQLPDMLVLMTWMQGLQLALQVAIVVISVISEMLGGVVLIVGYALGLWIFLTFVDEAHGFGSLLKALLVVVLWSLGVAVGLSILLAMIGVSAGGMV